MDDRLSAWIRALLAVVGIALLVAGIALASQQAVAVVLILGGIVLVLVAANGERLDEVSLTKGGAKWRRRVIEAVRQQTAEGVVVRPDPVKAETTVPSPTVEVGPPPRRLERRASDTLTMTDEIEAAVGHPEDEAAVLTTPQGFARLILETVEAERRRLGAEEYWAEARRIGSDDHDYGFTLDLRGLTEAQSRRLAEQARLAARQASPSVRAVLDAVAEAAEARADALPGGGPPNVIQFVVGLGGDLLKVTRDRGELAALSIALANQKDELVGHMWRQITRQVAPT